VEVCTLLSVILLVISLTLSALFVLVFLVDLFDVVVTLTANLTWACGDMAVLISNVDLQ